MKILTLVSIIFFINFLKAECSDLDSIECVQWSEYCEWNEETGECTEIGGGGGGSELGPYQIAYLTEADGIRNGPNYNDGRLYYPIGANPPLKSIVLTPGWGGGSSYMVGWAEFFASYGFIAIAIGPNDEINDSHEMRAEGLIDAIETIKEEDYRSDSPLFGLVDHDKFIVSGYSMGGGASQVALVLDHPYVDEAIVAAIALNPTIIFEDCDICSESEYCICLVPEFLEHDIPTLVIAGQNELNELPSYEGLLGQDIYENTPESTLKILYEIESGGHGSAEVSSISVQEKVLQWVNYHLLEDLSYCDSLLSSPNNASQFLTTLECETSISYDLNEDGEINSSDLTSLVIFIMYDNQSINPLDINFDSEVDIFDVLGFSDFIENTN
jgi:pimeloyl-ACP methyl ester carboxylesterase